MTSPQKSPSRGSLPYGTFKRHSPWLLASAIAVLAVVGAATITRRQDVANSKFWEAALSGLLTIAAGAVVTGVISVFASVFRDRQERKRSDHDFIEQQIVRLWDAHDTLKTAAGLIATHQSAKTYGEQLRTLIGVRTSLSDVEGVLERRLGKNTNLFDFEQFNDRVGVAANYVHLLVDEFRKQYMDVSHKQRIDEHINDGLAKKGVTMPDSRSILAWTALNDGKQFPRLGDLITFGNLTSEQLKCAECEKREPYVSYFDPLTSAIQVLSGVTSPDGS